MQFLLLLSGVGWLIPNHYLPWPAAWNDGASIAWLLITGLVVSLKSQTSKIGLPISLIVLFSTLSTVILVQLCSGKTLFFGDGVMALLYVFVFFLAVLLGKEMACQEDGLGNLVFGGWILAASVSTFIALNQWTGSYDLGIFSVDLKPEGRPFGNLAQPNNFCTVCFIGLCSSFFLNQRQVLGSLATTLLASLMMLGMVISQSRTGVLQVAFLFVGYALFFRRKENAGLSIKTIALLSSGFFFISLFWHRISSGILLSSSTRLGSELASEARYIYWRSIIGAIKNEPLWGYGWQQAGVAQQRIANESASVNSYFEHAHNIVLDLMLWNGVPISIFIAACLFLWVKGLAEKNEKPNERLLFILPAGIFIHAMLEYPLEYAYILIPFGLIFGLIGEKGRKELSVSISRSVRITFFVLMVPAFLLVAVEYIKMEEGFRLLRLESARIGAGGITSKPPSSRVLTQLAAFQKFASVEANSKMSRDDLRKMDEVAQRFPYPPVLFRYSLALGLNGQLDASLDTLRKICSMHNAERCKEARTNWTALKVQYPELNSIEF